MNKKIYFFFLCIYVLLSTTCMATYLTIPTWSESAVVESSGEVGENF